MSTQISIKALEEEERQARMRLARHRAKLYAAPSTATMAARLHVAELERRWRSAAERLRRARRATSA